MNTELHANATRDPLARLAPASALGGIALMFAPAILLCVAFLWNLFAEEPPIAKRFFG